MIKICKTLNQFRFMSRHLSKKNKFQNIKASDAGLWSKDYTGAKQHIKYSLHMWSSAYNRLQGISEDQELPSKRSAALLAIFTFAVFRFPVRQGVCRTAPSQCWQRRAHLQEDPSNWVSPSLMVEMSNKKFNTGWNNPGFRLISFLALKITKSNKISDGAYC